MPPSNCPAVATVPLYSTKEEEVDPEETPLSPGTVPEERFDALSVVSEAPEPLKTVAATVPVDGLKVNLVDDTFCGKLPVVVVTHVGYIVALVVVSLVIAVLVAFVAVVAVVALPDKAPEKVPAVKVFVLGLYVNVASLSCNNP